MYNKKGSHIGIILLLVSLFLLVGIATQAGAMESKAEPKGAKQIHIGILDLSSKIAVAALWNDAYKQAAEKRGWKVTIFDVDWDYSKTQPYMENMITAGYDAIIVNWTSPKYYEDQVLKAFKKGIPVASVAGGKMVPGFFADFAPIDLGRGAEVGQYLASKMEPGKVVIFTYKESENNLQKYLGQKMAMDYFKIEVHEVAQRGSGGDPTEQAYEDMKNLLLADSKKEIKGVLDYWEGKAYGSARACHEMGRDDVMVVTIDDSPRTYELMRQLPALRATFGVNGHRNMVAEKMCSMFEEIFAGKPFHDQNYFPLVPYLVEKENLPPQGFIYRPGPAPYEGKPDYKAE